MEQLTLSLEARPASPSALPGGARALQASQASCSSTFDAFASFVRDGLCGRTSRERSQARAGRLSKSTVKTHIRHIYEKCEVSSRQALIDLLQSHPED